VAPSPRRDHAMPYGREEREAPSRAPHCARTDAEDEHERPVALNTSPVVAASEAKNAKPARTRSGATYRSARPERDGDHLGRDERETDARGMASAATQWSARRNAGGAGASSSCSNGHRGKETRLTTKVSRCVVGSRAERHRVEAERRRPRSRPSTQLSTRRSPWPEDVRPDDGRPYGGAGAPSSSRSPEPRPPPRYDPGRDRARRRPAAAGEDERPHTGPGDGERDREHRVETTWTASTSAQRRKSSAFCNGRAARRPGAEPERRKRDGERRGPVDPEERGEPGRQPDAHEHVAVAPARFRTSPVVAARFPRRRAAPPRRRCPTPAARPCTAQRACDSDYGVVGGHEEAGDHGGRDRPRMARPSQWAPPVQPMPAVTRARSVTAGRLLSRLVMRASRPTDPPLRPRGATAKGEQACQRSSSSATSPTA